MTSAAVPYPKRHARMGHYAIWQSRDFVFNIAIVSMLLFGLLGFLTVMQVQQSEAFYAMRRGAGVMPVAAKVNIFIQIFGMFATVAPIIALSGIVSQDRTNGYTRFLFSKPVSPVWFYLQSFLIRMAGFLVMGTLLMLAYSHYEPPAFNPKILVDMSLSFVAIGGIIFLLSVVSRFDWLVGVLVLLISAVLWGRWETIGGIKQASLYLLPPMGKSGLLHQWMVGLTTMGELGPVPFPTKWALWSAGYGLACLVLGLYLLRRVPLTKA